MKLDSLDKNGFTGEKRLDVESASGDASRQASTADDSPVNMNTPSPKPRGYRADQLIEMAGDDSYSLTGEAPRRTKMKG